MLLSFYMSSLVNFNDMALIIENYKTRESNSKYLNIILL